MSPRPPPAVSGLISSPPCPPERLFLLCATSENHVLLLSNCKASRFIPKGRVPILSLSVQEGPGRGLTWPLPPFGP